MRSRTSHSVTLLVLALALPASPAPAWAGAWNLGHGRLHLKESFSFWSTDRKFASGLDRTLTFADRGPVERGERVPFDPATGGDFSAAALTTEVSLGLLGWLDVGLSVPLIWTDFDTAPVDTVDSSFGVGDLLLKVQGGWIFAPVALAGRLEVKVPTGGFDPSIYAAPLTEGQWDVALLASAGVSLHPWGYVNAELGWRFRIENPENGLDPGDEFLFLVEGGVRLRWGFWVKLAADGQIGLDGELTRFGTITEVPRRRLFSLWGGLQWRGSFGLGAEVALRVLLAGEDFPTGLQLLTGVSYEFQLFGGAG